MVAVVATGCHRTAPDSQEFQDAFQLYNQLYAASLDDSYSDPRMGKVLELLARVDPNSPQAAEAKDLQDKVEKGVAEAKARAARVAADQQAAAAPAPMQGFSNDLPPPSKPAPPPGPPAGPALGMTRDDFQAKFGDCFDRRGDYEQGARKGEAFGLLPACKERYPGFADSLVVLIENKVASLMPLADVTVRTVDAGSPPPPPPPVAPPPPTTVRYLPGVPVPGSEPAPATP